MEVEKLSGSAVTLLIVDDEPLMTDLFREAMSRRGFRVLSAGSGADALAIVAKQAVDLAITDMTMPGMGGVEFARALNAMASPLQVLIATGHDTDEATMQLPSNIVGILSKLYRHAALADQIRQILK